MTHRKQLLVFLIMLVLYTLAVFISYTFFGDQLSSTTSVAPSLPQKTLSQPMWVYGLAASGMVMVMYGLVGLIGYWLTRRVGLPGIFSPGCGWRRWALIPFLIAIPCALFMMVLDLFFAPINGLGRLPHPPFPVSIFSSLSAGIGEEILFRSFVFGLWSLILTWVLKRFNGRTIALWIANVIAALAFSASHLFTAAILANAVVFDTAGSATFLFDKLNPLLVVEIFLLNGVIGLLAGWRYMKDGLVAASSVHFWTDMIWHVLWGLIPA